MASRALPAGPPRQSPRAKAGGGPTRHRVPPPAQRWDPPHVSRGWSRLLREHPAVRPIPGSRSRVRTHCGPLPHARAAPPGTFSALALHDLNTRVYPDFSQRRGSCLRSIAILPGPDPRGPGAWSPRARAPRHLRAPGPWASSVTALRPAPPAATRGSSSSLSRCPEVQAPRDYVSEREVPTTLPPPLWGADAPASRVLRGGFARITLREARGGRGGLVEPHATRRLTVRSPSPEIAP